MKLMGTRLWIIADLRTRCGALAPVPKFMRDREIARGSRARKSGRVAGERAAFSKANMPDRINLQHSMSR